MQFIYGTAQAAQFPEVLTLFKDGDVLIVLGTNGWLVWLLASVVAGLVLAQVFSIVAVIGMLLTLRKNSSSFTARTYRLHLQLTFLLLAQVIRSQPTMCGEGKGVTVGPDPGA